MKNQKGQSTLGVIGVILAVIALSVGLLFLTGVISLGYDATIERKHLDIDAENKRHAYENQQSLRDTAGSKITEWSSLESGSPHEIALRNEICTLVSQMDGDVPSNITNWSGVNCA